MGEGLGKDVLSPKIILLHGPLGAGKTVFAKGLIQGLGCNEPVTSPTFVLAQQYHGRFPIWHVDLYRLDRSSLEEIGIREHVDRSVVIIEWGERLQDKVEAGMWMDFSVISEVEREIAVRE